MRALLLLFTCFIVVGIVLFAMLQAPTSRKPALSVARLESVQRPLPVLESDPAPDRILESFPDPKDFLAEAPNPQDAASVENVQKPVRDRTQATGAKKMDLNRLLALIDDWIYNRFFPVRLAEQDGDDPKDARERDDQCF